MKIVLATIATLFGVLASVFLFFVWNGTITFGPSLSDMPARVGDGGVMLRVVSGCSNALPWSELSKVASVERAATRLTAVVLANATCGDIYPVKPVVKRQDQSLELAWSWWSPAKDGSLAACRCTRHIEFTIPGIDGATPAVTIAAQNQQMN